LQEKYGVSCTLDIPSVREKLESPSTERLVAAVLSKRYKIEYIHQYTIGPYSFDFFVPSLNLLIECQGDYFHNFKENGYSGTPKDRSKSSYVENNTNFKLVWIYEHEIHIGRLHKILDYHIFNAIEPATDFELKDLSFSSIPNADAHQFLSKYHYLGNLGTVATCWGAFHNSIPSNTTKNTNSNNHPRTRICS